MHHSQLLLDLQTSFDDLELRQLCASLQIQYDRLPGYGRGEKIHTLIALLEKDQRLADLGDAVVAARPHLARYYQPDELSWLDEIASGMAVSTEQLPTLNWAGDPASAKGQAVEGNDAREQLLGQMPTMHWRKAVQSTAKAQTPTGPNPYLAETIVKDPEMFFGRKAELARLLAGVRQGHSWLITGLKGIGKSSLLYRFAHHTPSPPADKLIFAYLDLSHPAFDCQKAVYDAALKQWYGTLIDAPAPSAVDAGHFARQIRTLYSAEFKVILCLEAPDQMLNQEKVGPDLLRQLADLVRDGKLILATAADPGQAAAISRDPAGAEFLALLQPLPLSLLDVASAESLLIAPSARRGVLILAQAVTDGLRYSGRHPQFLQLMGCVLFDIVTQGAYDRAKCQTAFQLMAGIYWIELWEQLSSGQRQSLISPIRREAPLVLARHYPTLLELGLLAAEGQELKRFSRGFELWIAEQNS